MRQADGDRDHEHGNGRGAERPTGAGTDAPVDRHRLPQRHARRQARGRGGRGLRRRRAVRAGPHRRAGTARGGPPALPTRSGSRSRMYQPLRDFEAMPEERFAANLRRAEAQVRGHGRARRGSAAGVLERLLGGDRRRRSRRRAAARAGRARRRARHPHRLRGARLGAPRARLRPRVADRAGRRPPEPRHLPGLVPHPLARRGPGRDPRHPGREDLLPPARRRAGPGHGRAAVEPPLPLLPRAGRLRPRGLPRPRAGDGLRRAAVARGVQRRLPPGRPAADGGRRDALAAAARGRSPAGRGRCAATRSRSWRWTPRGPRAWSGC